MTQTRLQLTSCCLKEFETSEVQFDKDQTFRPPVETLQSFFLLKRGKNKTLTVSNKCEEIKKSASSPHFLLRRSDSIHQSPEGPAHLLVLPLSTGLSVAAARRFLLGSY